MTMRRTAGALAAVAFGLLLLPADAAAVDFTVNSSADPGDGLCDATDCTLREAIEEANGNDATDSITFDGSLAGGTILLSSGQLAIVNDTDGPDLTIDGDLNDDGTPDITVDAQSNSRVFEIASGADATLEGLVITGGNSVLQGGGILNNNGTLKLLAAGDLLEQGEVDDACAQLQDATDRTDGAFPPPDFVEGEDALDLLDAITAVQGELGCFA